MTFIHLNVHSKASMLYGSADIKKLVGRAKELGQPAVALADYSNVFEAVNFYRAAQSAGIKPIMGVDLYFCEDAEQLRIQKVRQVSHIVLLAENEIGWRNITRLISHANSPEYFFYNPRVDFKLLEQYSEGVICLTGSTLDGVLSSLLFDQLDESGEVRQPAALFKAEGLVRRFLKIFDTDHLFLEIQDTDLDMQKQVSGRLRNIATKYDLRTVATNNVHYVEQHDAEAHKTLLEMSANKYSRATYTDFMPEEYYLKTRKEMEERGFTADELDLTMEIADRCNVDIDLKKRRLPKYKFIPNGKTSNEYLRELATNGLIQLNLDSKMGASETYGDRLTRELADIEEMGFADYFLIVHDVMSWVREQNILVGRGRGSAGGSLVSYALGITEIDPIEYGLIWERFLNKGRGGLPDIDTDVPRSKRQKVLEYIRERFGAGNVAQLVTLGGLQAKAILKEVFKVYNLPFDEANRITALIPAKNDDHVSISLQEAIDVVPELKEYYDKYTPWFKVALALEGCYKATGIHAAAVVISDVPFEESSYPLARSKDGNLLFGWDMNTVDSLSLLKLDILGLTTLDDIQVTMDLVKERRGIELSRSDMPLDDAITWDMLGKGFTIGVFQIEKQLGRTWSKNLQPKSIEELSDLVSIIRPGPLDSGMGKAYRRVKSKGETPQYIHPMLEPIMGTTYSALLYQEQVIYICQQLAGMNSIDADMVRKAMGKKKPEEMQKWKEVFIGGCGKNNIDPITSDEIWGYIEKFAGYGFNKCLSFNTRVIRAGANQHKGREVTIGELWRYYHGDLKRTPAGKKYRNKTHPKLGLRILAMKDGRIKPDRIADVIQTGIKTTYKLKLDTGEAIRSTLDHKFWTTNGWKRLRDICIGDSVCVNTQYELTTVAASRKLNRFSNTTIDDRIFKKAKWFTPGEGNSSYIDGSYLSFKETRQKRIEEIGHCEQCNQQANRYELAHLDGDHTNQNDDNLCLMCVSCHKKYDYRHNNRVRRFEKGYPISHGTVIAIDDPQNEMTYDIEMCGDEHNYIANGMVTHNSHGVGYALLAYETAYLKANYTVEFLCAKLRHADSHPNKFEQMSALSYDGKLFDIDVVPPRVSMGNKDFAVVDDTHIAFGLTALKGVGATAVTDLIKIGRDCKTFDDILWKWKTKKSKVNAGVMSALICGGAFDDIEEHRVQSQGKFRLLDTLTNKEVELVQELMPYQEGDVDWIRIVRAIADESKAILIKEKFCVKIPNARRRPVIRDALREYDARELFDTKAQRIAWEQFFLGIALSGSEADIYRAQDKCIDLVKSGYTDMSFEIAVRVDAVREHIVGKGKSAGQPMAFVTASDNTFSMDNIVVFPRTYDRAKRLLEGGNVIKIKGKISDQGSLIAERVERLR